jgi:uroporphyrinogen decarboxylase
MEKLTSRERFIRTIKRQEIDRIPIMDSPWAGTIARWHREGMPHNVSWIDFFGVDSPVYIGVDTSPRYPGKVLEETDDYVISTTGWGVTLKNFKVLDSTPEFIDYYVNTPEHWEEAKARMTPTDDRINWNWLKQNYPIWKKNDEYISGGFWFGFDVTHSWMVGTETLLVGMYENPEWVKDIIGHYLEMDLALFTKIWDAGYHFDAINWPDDMGYKGTQFFSIDMYREIIKPFHKKACDWAHERGINVELHSCGNIEKFIPDLIEIGIDCLNPIEVKAGMDPVKLKRLYGDKLAFRGGINAVLWDNIDAISEEMHKVIPVMKENQGYIFSSDHSIPNSVSLENFKK